MARPARARRLAHARVRRRQAASRLDDRRRDRAARSMTSLRRARHTFWPGALLVVALWDLAQPRVSARQRVGPRPRCGSSFHFPRSSAHRDARRATRGGGRGRRRLRFAHGRTRPSRAADLAVPVARGRRRRDVREDAGRCTARGDATAGSLHAGARGARGGAVAIAPVLDRARLHGGCAGRGRGGYALPSAGGRSGSACTSSGARWRCPSDADEARTRRRRTSAPRRGPVALPRSARDAARRSGDSGGSGSLAIDCRESSSVFALGWTLSSPPAREISRRTTCWRRCRSTWWPWLGVRRSRSRAPWASEPEASRSRADLAAILVLSWPLRRALWNDPPSAKLASTERMHYVEGDWSGYGLPDAAAMDRGSSSSRAGGIAARAVRRAGFVAVHLADYERLRSTPERARAVRSCRSRSIVTPCACRP